MVRRLSQLCLCRCRSAPIPDAQAEDLAKPSGPQGKKDKGKGKASSTVRNGRERSGSAPAVGAGLAGASGTVFNDIPMRPIPIDGRSPNAARSESPAVERRPGFRPIGGFAPVSASSNGGTDSGAAGVTSNGSASASRGDGPAGGGGVLGERLAIPIQVKRKAAGEPLGTPDRKR